MAIKLINGKFILVVHLMSILNCGNISNSIGELTLTGKKIIIKTNNFFFLFLKSQILDAKYNLKRWQIGEIASKIGQLYYHY